MKNGIKWSRKLEESICTPEEIAENDFQVELLSALIEAREEKGISQRELEALSGIAQSAIARVERGNISPTVSTLSRLLYPLGKKLVIAPI